MKLMVPPLCIVFTFLTFFSYGQLSKNNGARKMDPEKSILKNTEASNNHKTLLAAMRATDLDELLAHDGQFTVFAPSDKAFEKLPETQVKTLLNPQNRELLKSVMTYHIVAGKLSASKILKAMCRGRGTATFTTVNGDKLTATMSGIDIVLTDGSGHTAKITTADSDQCNGVIHQIDSVILPSKL